ncbi:MAG TPA: helix-turn-helix domain-containing protein [Terriglobales bacterium]|nr:helix-turn-helix domain-containing protein [Terriglobales bacterium]
MKETGECPVEYTLEVIGGKWKCVLLWHLRKRVRRFNELRRLLPNATQKVLTSQLRQLERDGLISRTVYAEVPPRVEYSITPYGESLSPVLELMCHWGLEHKQNHRVGQRKVRAPRMRPAGYTAAASD